MAPGDVTAAHEATYVPDPPEQEQLAVVLDFLTRHERAGRGVIAARYFLAGAEPGEQVELPENVYKVVRQVVHAMRSGLAVTVAPRTQVLTTQQAADLLGVSRPTVIKLLDTGQVPFTKAGTHRRILLADLLSYQEHRRAEQYAALEATSENYDTEEDLDTVLTQLRQARKAVAARRRAVT